MQPIHPTQGPGPAVVERRRKSGTIACRLHHEPEAQLSAPGGPVHVMVVEDDEVELMALRRALKDARTPHVLTVAHDGLEALETLTRPGDAPALIFLDLNMPRMNGLEFLDALRADPLHAAIDVVVVTTSAAKEDQRAAWAGHVVGYVVKSMQPGGLQLFASMVDGFLARAAAARGPSPQWIGPPRTRRGDP